jgi:hypothetical protein
MEVAMGIKTLSKLIHGTLVCLLALTLSTGVFPQGRGRGGGGGGGRGVGGSAGGPPSGIGVDRGFGNASERSGRSSDRGRGTASEKSNGRSNAGLDRARMASSNLRHADEDLANHPGVPRALHTNANSLRSGYKAALATNPDLKFGQYVAATRLAQNLGSRFPNITRGAILAGLASGRSIGQTLHDLGLGNREASDAKKRADREIKQARKQ